MRVYKLLIAIAATILLSSISFAQIYHYSPTLRPIHIEKRDGKKVLCRNPRYNNYDMKTSILYDTTNGGAVEQHQHIQIICNNPGYEKCRLNTAYSDTLQYVGAAIPMHKIDKQINRLLNKIDRKLRWGKKQDFLIKMISIKADERTFVFRISVSYEGNKKGDADINIHVRAVYFYCNHRIPTSDN